MQTHGRMHAPTHARMYARTHARTDGHKRCFVAVGQVPWPMWNGPHGMAMWNGRVQAKTACIYTCSQTCVHDTHTDMHTCLCASLERFVKHVNFHLSFRRSTSVPTPQPPRFQPSPPSLLAQCSQLCNTNMSKSYDRADSQSRARPHPYRWTCRRPAHTHTAGHAVGDAEALL